VRILVATDQWSPDVVGGSARVAADTARALARRGHEIVVLAPAQRDRPKVGDDGGVEVRRLIRRGPLPQTIVDPVLTFRHARALRQSSFDVLVAHQPTNAVGLASALGDTPLAVVFHASPLLELRFLRRQFRGVKTMPMYVLDPVLGRQLAEREPDHPFHRGARHA